MDRWVYGPNPKYQLEAGESELVTKAVWVWVPMWYRSLVFRVESDEIHQGTMMGVPGCRTIVIAEISVPYRGYSCKCELATAKSRSP